MSLRLSGWIFPEPVISVAVEPKTKATKKKWVLLSANWRKKILHFVYTPMKNPAKPLSQVWVSCIWKSLSIV